MSVIPGSAVFVLRAGAFTRGGLFVLQKALWEPPRKEQAWRQAGPAAGRGGAARADGKQPVAEDVLGLVADSV